MIVAVAVVFLPARVIDDDIDDDLMALILVGVLKAIGLGHFTRRQ